MILIVHYFTTWVWHWPRITVSARMLAGPTACYQWYRGDG